MIADRRTKGRLQVLELIRRSGQIARSDIATEVEASPATVTAATADLLAAGLIEEIAPVSDAPQGKRGRPRVALRIVPNACKVVGIKVSDRSMSVVIMNLGGETLSEIEVDLPNSELAPESLVEVIIEAVGSACKPLGLSMSDLSAAGLGLAGFVDADRGFVHWSPSLNQRNVQLKSLLNAHSPIPFFLDNDANLVAKAEQIFGEGQGVSDFVVITIETGIGMGVIIDNAIYRGARGCGAEIGHSKVQLEGALCRCGQRGCLEAYVADYALLREANLRAGPELSQSPDDALKELLVKAKAGDAFSSSIFNRAGRMLAMGLANVINIFDPKLIILSGERMQFDLLYADEVLDAVKSWVVSVDAPLPEIRIHKWGDLMWAKGAASYAIEEATRIAVRNIANAA